MRIPKKRNFAGQIGSANNLFSGLCYCGFCGSKMSYETKTFKDRTSKYEYLTCENGRRKFQCQKISIPYGEFETAILNHCSGLDIENLPDDSNRNERKTLENQLIATDAELAQTEKRIENLLDSIMNAESLESKKSFEERHAFIVKVRRELHIRKNEIENRLKSLSATGTQENLDSLQKAIAALDEIPEKSLSDAGVHISGI